MYYFPNRNDEIRVQPEPWTTQYDWMGNAIPVHEQRCLHLSCPQCHGTGRKQDGQLCVHMLSCPCPRCSPRM